LSLNLSKLITKLINNKINLLNINKICIFKPKKYFTKIKNRKNTIIQIEKIKIKFIKRNFLNLEYINIIIKVLYNN